MSDGITEALSLYGLENAKIILLRHNENRTYRIDYDKKSYCLRLKNPISGFDLSVLGGEQEALLRSELDFIKMLGEQTDIPVQSPVKTLSGDLVARLSDGTLASLLSWMDGISFDKDKRTEQMLVSAGKILAKLRSTEEAMSNPDTFTRLTYDQKLVERLAVRAEQGSEYLPAETIKSIVSTLKAMAGVMDEMDGNETAFIAHSDPGLGNMIWANGRVGLIDWSLCGYAHSYMDVGGLMGATSDREEQRLLLKGWESIRGKANRRFLDAFFSLTVLLFVCCQYTRAKEWTDWFPVALDRWQATVFEPFSSGYAIPCIL
ncbi:MAG: phosphotransferase [Clostridiales bacterium]|nr:phosphotransferase [Clostridiales bacterium]